METCDLATVNLTIKYDIYHVRLLFLLKRVIVFGPVTPGANIKSYYDRSYSMVVACTFFIPMVTCCYSCLSPEDRKRKVSFERISDCEFIARLAVGSLIWESQSLRCVTFQVTARRNLARRCHGSRQLSSPRFQLRVLQLVSCQSKISPVNFSTETLTMDFKNSRRNEKWLIRSAKSRHAGSRILKEKKPINHNSDEQRKQDESNQLECFGTLFLLFY